MQSLEKHVEKQIIVRMFEPDMNVLKQAARQISAMPDTALNLYGQGGEVLLVAKVRAIAEAAATQMTENIAEQLEQALGDAVYGRGKGSLAYFTAGELIENECIMAAADPKTGALLAEEFSHTKRGASVYDFGDSSYGDSRVMEKIKAKSAKRAEDGNSASLAAARAEAAAKCSRADVGVAVTGGGEGKHVYLAVYYKGYVYMRRFSPSADVGKHAALAALDITRRLMLNAEVNARTFKAGAPFDWNAPAQPKKRNPYLVPVIVLAVLLVALAVACWYFFSHFTLGSEQDNVPAASVSSAAQQLPESGSAQLPESVSQSQSAAAGGDADASAPSSQPAAAMSTPAADANGVVSPFA